MPKVNGAVINCSSSTYKLKKWKQEICYEHNNLCIAVNEKNAFIAYHHSIYTVFQAY